MEFSGYDFNAKIKANDLHIECFSTKAMLSIEAMIEEIKAIISEKLQFENRDESELHFFENPNGQEFDTWMETNGFLIKSSSTGVKFSASETDGRNQTCSC